MPCLDANQPARSRYRKHRERPWLTVHEMELCGMDLRGMSLRITDCGFWGEWTAQPIFTRAVEWPTHDPEDDGA